MQSNRPAPRRRALRRRNSLALGSLLAALAALVFTALLAPTPASADQLSDKRAQADQVAAKLASLQSQADELSYKAEKTRGDIIAAQQAVADAQARADQANADMQAREAELRGWAIDAYMSGDSSSGVDALLTSQSQDSVKVKGYIEVTTGNRQDLVDQLKATKKKAEDEGAQLQAAQADLESRNQQLQSSLDAAQAAVDEQASIKSGLDSQISQLVAAEQAAKAAEAQRQAEARAQQAGAAAQAAQATGGATPNTQAAPTAPATVTTPPTTPTGPEPPVGVGAGAAIAAARSKIGAPYVWAAAGPNSFDCSGFTMWAWAHGGKSLPHYSGAQYAMSRRISASEAQPGDLVFFWGPGESGDPGHVGLYLGGGSFIHAPGSGKFVRIDSVGYWSGARVAYGRI